MPEPTPSSNEPVTPAAATPAVQPVFEHQPPAAPARSEEAWLAQEQKLRDAQKAAQDRNDLQAKLDKIEADKLAEQGKYKELYEKEQASRRQTEAQMRSRVARAELRAYAIAEGIIDPDLVNLIPSKDIKVNDDTGEFENIRDLIADQKKAKPHLYKGTAASAGSATPTTGDTARTPAADGSAKPKDVSKMSKEEYAVWKRDSKNGLRAIIGRRS